MTLRLRLVGALVLLVAVGLALFGVATYSLYSRSQYGQLDNQLRGATPSVGRQLLQEVSGFGSGPGPSPAPGSPVAGGQGGGPGRGPGGGPGSGFFFPGAYGELISGRGTVLAHVQLPNGTSTPAISASELADPTRTGRLFTTGSTSGSERWRVFVGTAPFAAGDALLVAVPTASVETSLHRLILIELSGALILLALLTAGAWVVLRRGLSPLERVADTAGRISAGDLTQRVATVLDRSEVGRLGSAFNTMLDEIESAFQERDATETRLRQFLADASHELRTPLTSIQGFAELFRLGADDPTVDLPTIMRRIEQESGRMRELVEDLLLLAQLDQTRAFEAAPVDLTVLAADACSDARAAAPHRQVTLDAPEPVVVLGHQAHLRQAIANLMTNAITHTPDGTPIDVEVGLAGGTAEVTVRDHGPGLDPAARGHAFDRFWQADRARAGQGAGLGLSIVSAIASEHGGRAEVDNAPDGGARFRLSLPLLAGTGATADQ